MRLDYEDDRPAALQYIENAGDMLSSRGRNIAQPTWVLRVIH